MESTPPSYDVIHFRVCIFFLNNETSLRAARSSVLAYMYRPDLTNKKKSGDKSRKKKNYNIIE